MPSVQIEITIDEEQLSEKAAQWQEKIEAKAYQYYCELSLLAACAGEGRGGAAILAGIYFQLDRCTKYLYNKYKERQAQRREEEKEYIPRHSILCECGWSRCLGHASTIGTYARKIKAVQ